MDVTDKATQPETAPTSWEVSTTLAEWLTATSEKLRLACDRLHTWSRWRWVLIALAYLPVLLFLAGELIVYFLFSEKEISVAGITFLVLVLLLVAGGIGIVCHYLLALIFLPNPGRHVAVVELLTPQLRKLVQAGSQRLEHVLGDKTGTQWFEWLLLDIAVREATLRVEEADEILARRSRSWSYSRGGISIHVGG